MANIASPGEFALKEAQEETRLVNEAFFEHVMSDDPVLQKQAADSVNEFTRFKMREDGFLRKILPPLPLTNDELDRQQDTDRLVKVVDYEGDTPAAISVGFATLPETYWILGRRYLVTLSRILSPRWTGDVALLRTWHMDIRQVLSDNSLKDMLAEEDSKFISAVNTSVGPVDTVMPTTGVAQHQSFSGGFTRDTLWEAEKILPSTPSSFEVKTVLLNNITIKDICKLNLIEFGGEDLAQGIMKNGWTSKEFMGVEYIITIKRDLVPNNVLFYFADPTCIGKHYMLDDTTMAIKREFFMLDFFNYQCSGVTIGNVAGVAKATFE